MVMPFGVTSESALSNDTKSTLMKGSFPDKVKESFIVCPTGVASL
jgi:hypothetical protein